MNMSYPSRKEYLDVLRHRYAKASTRQEKSQIIDEAVNTLGYHRKHVIRELNRSNPKRSKPRRRQKPLLYKEAIPTIQLVWEALDYPCAERLHPALVPTALSLQKHGELVLTPMIQDQLEQISRATLGRYLQRFDSPKAKRRMPRRKPQGLIRSIPVENIRLERTTPWCP